MGGGRREGKLCVKSCSSHYLGCQLRDPDLTEGPPSPIKTTMQFEPYVSDEVAVPHLFVANSKKLQSSCPARILSGVVAESQRH